MLDERADTTIIGIEGRGAKLRLRLVDGLSAAIGDTGTLRINSRKAAALLAYLALDEDRSASRERLSGLLWSDRAEEQARASLRQNLKQLREIFDAAGFQGFEADRQEVRLSRAEVVTDLQMALDQIRAGERQTAVPDEFLAPDLILYGYDSLDHAFTSWLHVARETWRRRLTEGLEAMLSLPGCGPPVRRWAAQALCRLDPSHEDASHVLIELLAREGNAAAALKVYADHWRFLEDEFDMEPAVRTQQLIADIKLGSLAPAAPGQAGPDMPASPPVPAALPAAPAVSVLHRPPRLPIVAVGDFVAIDNDPSVAQYVRLFRQDLIANLVRFREWVVVDGLQPAAEPDREAGDAAGLATSYAIDATCLRDGDQHRAVVTLMDVRRRQYLWSEQFLLGATNRFEAMRRIVRRMAVGINTHLSAALVSRHIADPDVAPEAYDIWIRAHDLIWSWQPELRREAEAMFLEVIRLSPRFAPAYAGMASVYNTHHAVTPGFFPSETLVRQATDYARRAVELDPLDVRCRIALAWSNAMAQRFDLAKLQYDLAYELNPNNPTTLVSCANGLALCGDLAEAKALAQLAMDITPTFASHHWAYLVGVRFLAGDYDGCVVAADLSGQIIPVVLGWRAAALGMAGRTDEAQVAGARFLRHIGRLWQGGAAPEPGEIVNWFLQNFPLREDGARKRIEEGLLRAGLPPPDR